MPRTLDQIVREQLGTQALQLAQQQSEIERLTEENQKLQKDLNDLLQSKPPTEKERA